MTTRRGSRNVAERVRRIDWSRVGHELDADGWSRLPGLLAADECGTLARDYDRDEIFRSTVDMERYRFGRGQYRYFARPLPDIVGDLRRLCYEPLAAVANAWMEKLGEEQVYPPALNAFLEQCRAAGQTRPTPLLLRYGKGDYNCLHQDRYGPLAFPLQIAIALSENVRDYEGGELILHEQRPRAQSKATAVRMVRGEGIVFASGARPVLGRRGFHRVQMRHGASPIRRGRRFVLGIIFHDAA